MSGLPGRTLVLHPEIPERPRLVVVRPDRVGDVIVSSSCLAALHERWPGAEVAWMVRPVMAPLFQDHPRIQRLLLLPSEEKFSWRARVKLLRQSLEEFAPSAIFLLHPDPVIQLAAWLAKIPCRLGYSSGLWKWTLTEAIPYRKSEGLKHEAEYNFDLLSRAGVPQPKQLQGDVVLPDAGRQSLDRKLGWNWEEELFVALNPSAFSPVARWPVEYFERVAEKLLQRPDLRLVITGDSREDPSACELGKSLDRWGDRVTNLAGLTDLAELGQLLRRARALVTRDTGASHLAAAVHCPVVVIFGRSDPIYGPTRWRPLGEPVEIFTHRLTRQAGEKREAFWKRCYASITPEEVLGRVENFLPPLD